MGSLFAASKSNMNIERERAHGVREIEINFRNKGNTYKNI